MQNNAQPIPAPQGAVAWTPSRGFVYERPEAAAAVDAGETVHVVSRDGYLRGVAPSNRAPLVALLRVEGDVAELVARVGDLGETVAGLDAGESVDVSDLRSRVAALTHRVVQLEAR